MAFTFGGGAAARPSLFGGAAAAGSTSGAVSGTGSFFGTNPATGGMFGGTAAPSTTGLFGASATSTSGGLFGGATGGQASGGLFGQQTSAAPGFGFGSTSAAPSFGFGAAAATSSSFTGFGGGATGAFSFAAPAATSAGFGLGAAAPRFGTATSTLGFGGAGAFGGFGAGAQTGMFGAKTSAAPTMSFSGFGTQAQAPQQGQQGQGSSSLSCVATAVSMPTLFGDERDAVIARWNQLQALWGAGRGYFTPQGQYVDFTPDNPFCLFKAVGYSCVSGARNEDGLVVMTIARSMAEVCEGQQQIVDFLHRLLGSKPNLTICVDGVRPVLDDKVELTFYVQDRTASGTTTRVTATDVFAFLNQPTNQQQLACSLHVSGLVPRVSMSPDQLKLYLDHSAAGIDARIWEQAKLDNPDPCRLLPVPMVGFSELHSRLKHQDQQTQLHLTRLDLIAADVGSLRHKLTDMVAKLDQYKRTQLLLSHRVLKVLVAQEVQRKHGYAVQAHEEQLRVHLETITTELNAPTQFKGRLNELMAQLRMQNQLGGSGGLQTGGALKGGEVESGYQMDPNVQQEVQQHLKQQQAGLKHLVDILNDDLDDLRLIELRLAEDSKLARR